MDYDKIGFHVNITMFANSLAGSNSFIVKGRGVNVVIEELFFPGRVVQCAVPILPGKSGRAVIKILGLSEKNVKISVSTRITLRDGPLDIGYADVTLLE